MLLFSFLYSWATEMEQQASTSQYAQFFRDYFSDSLCIQVFGIAFLVALIFSAIFYFGIGNFSYTLSKRIVWIIILALSTTSVYFLSDSFIIGTDNDSVTASSGVYEASYVTEGNLTNGKKGDEPKKIRKMAQSYRDLFRKNEVKLPHQISLLNAVYGFIFFWLLSFAFRKASKHAKFIPF